jgi:hypothetical protein
VLPDVPIEPVQGDPFVDERERTKPWKPLRGRSFPGRNVGTVSSLTPAKRLGTVNLQVLVDPAVAEWIHDRAAILDVPVGYLVRDVLVTWRKLVLDAERDRGISFDDDSVTLEVPERHPSYPAQLRPNGRAHSHLDGSPLGLEEL